MPSFAASPNQSSELVDYDLYSSHRALVDAGGDAVVMRSQDRPEEERILDISLHVNFAELVVEDHHW